MPIYEYHCGHCGTFETMQRITDAPLKRCPTCKGKVERIVSRTSFILKGSGWYATDYGRSGSTNSNSAGEGQTSATNSSPTAAASSDSGSTEKSSDSAKPSSEKSGSEKSAASK